MCTALPATDVRGSGARGCRRKRLAEMKAAAKKNKFGSVLPLERPEYVREVTEASNECWVVLHMHQG